MAGFGLVDVLVMAGPLAGNQTFGVTFGIHTAVAGSLLMNRRILGRLPRGPQRRDNPAELGT